jgi:hypothetical protein
MTKYLAPDIDAIIGKISDLSSIADYSVDFALASNLFEHIEQDEFALVLAQLKTKLKYSGTLNILQPNYRFSYREYFDDYTHLSVYSDRSLKDFLEVHGFQVFYCHPKFLPLTLKSVFPVYPLLIKMYLKLPYKPLGKQMFVRASVDGKQSCIMLPPT